MGQIDKAAELIEAKLRQRKHSLRIIAKQVIFELTDEDVDWLCENCPHNMQSIAELISKRIKIGVDNGS